MDAQDCVVRLDHGSSHLRAAPDGEGDLALLAIIHRQPCKLTRSSTTVRFGPNVQNWKQIRLAQPRQPLEHQAAKAGSCSAAACVVHAESLESCALLTEWSEKVRIRGTRKTNTHTHTKPKNTHKTMNLQARCSCQQAS